MQSEEKRQGPSLGEWIGRFLAALGLLSLFDSTEIVKIQGRIWNLVQAFNDLSVQIVGLLLSWIKLNWFDIDKIEANVLFLALLLGGAVFRGSFKVQRRSGDDVFLAFIGAAFPTFLVIILPIILACGFIPGRFGLLGGLVLLTILSYWAVFQNDQDDRAVPASRRVRRDLAWAIGIAFCVLVFIFAETHVSP